MGVSGVRGVASSSNHIIEVEKVLGIESARSTIMSEIQYTMGQHGMDIDTRYAPTARDARARPARDRAASASARSPHERPRTAHPVSPRGAARAGT